METVLTQKSPVPLGHYSQAVIHNGLVYVAGQLPIDPQHENQPLQSLEDQTRQVLQNLDEILLASGSDRNHVLKVTIYLTDLAHWATVNDIYGRFFGKHKPARSAVPVKTLPKGYFLEIDVIAAQVK